MEEIKFKSKDGKITIITPEKGSRLYTNRIDKNGTEIYAGDIVKTHDSQRDIYTINQVFWRNDMASWYLKSEKWFDTPLTFLEVEVIGNKYDDKHLSEKLKSDHEINGSQ